MADIQLPVNDRPYVLVQAAGERTALEIDSETIIELYKQHGALMFRGFDADLNEFSKITETFCSGSVFNDSLGREMLDADNNIQTVNLGRAAFELHSELAREPWKPDVCFFYCMRPPTAGGATTVCDGVAVVDQLPVWVRGKFEGRRLRYVRPATPETLEYWLGTPTPSNAELANPPPDCPYTFEVRGDRILRVFSRPALHTPMFTSEPAFGNFLLFARFMRNERRFPVLDDGTEVPDNWLHEVKAVGDRLLVPVAWQRGDLLMLDNTRFMHGRTSIIDVDERLIASFFGYLRFAVPNPEEPPSPIWRRETFRPPATVNQTRELSGAR